jgi:hypothetical protein
MSSGRTSPGGATTTMKCLARWIGAVVDPARQDSSNVLREDEPRGGRRRPRCARPGGTEPTRRPRCRVLSDVLGEDASPRGGDRTCVHHHTGLSWLDARPDAQHYHPRRIHGARHKPHPPHHEPLEGHSNAHSIDCPNPPHRPMERTEARPRDTSGTAKPGETHPTMMRPLQHAATRAALPEVTLSPTSYTPNGGDAWTDGAFRRAPSDALRLIACRA